MPAPSYLPHAADSTLTRAWLVRLRWSALLLQLVTISVGVANGLQLPVGAMISMMTLVAASNVGLARGTEPRWIPAVMVLDTAVLTGLLAVSGGPSNPFTSLYLVHVALAAVVLNPQWTWIISGVSAIGYALLFEIGNPHLLHSPDAADLHLHGMWAALTLTGAAIASFVARLAAALRAREQQLAKLLQDQAELEASKSRAEKLSSLATLAAGAAHEMGTPLATIAVASQELADELASHPDQQADLRLIQQQVERCREILAQMAGGAGQAMGELPETVEVERVWEEVRKGLPGAMLDRVQLAGTGMVTVPPRTFGRLLASLARNGLQAGSATVRVARTPTGFRVDDQGTGMSEEQLQKAGEPFYTTRSTGEGMGLGLFLARNVLQSLGGNLQIQSVPGQGTTVELRVP